MPLHGKQAVTSSRLSDEVQKNIAAEVGTKMTSIDPQAIAGPKASQTKFGLLAPSKTEDGAFLAYMTATIPAIPSGMMQAPGAPEGGIAPIDPSQSDDLPGNAVFPSGDQEDSSPNLEFAMRKALHVAKPDGPQTSQPVPAADKLDAGPLPSGPIVALPPGHAGMLIAQASSKPNAPGPLETPNSAALQHDTEAPHSTEKEQRLSEATTQTVQTDTNGLPILHALGRTQEFLRNVVSSPAVVQHPNLDFQPDKTDAIRFQRTGGADGPPAQPVNTQTQLMIGPETTPMRGDSPQKRAAEAIASLSAAQGKTFFPPPEMKQPTPIQHRSNVAPPPGQTNSPALVQTVQAALQSPTRPAPQSLYHEANHGVDTSSAAKSALHIPPEIAIPQTATVHTTFLPQHAALQRHAFPPELPANGAAVVQRTALEPPAPSLVPAFPQTAEPDLRVEAKPFPNSTSEPPLPPYNGARLPYFVRAAATAQPSPVFSVISSQTTDNDPGHDIAAIAPRHLSEVAGISATQPVAPPTTAQALGPPMQHQSVPMSAIATVIKEQSAPGKTKTIELTLAPEELGQIRLILQPDGDKMRIVVQAERPETLDLLRRNTETFSSELRQSGFANSSFSFGSWGEPPPRFAKSQKDSGPLSATTAPTIAPLALTNTPRPSAGLDLRV